MREEVAAAVVFVKRLVKRNKNMNDELVNRFCDQLTSILVEKFKNHWYTDTPTRGQAFRSIHVDETGPADPVLQKAAVGSNLCYGDLHLPPEFTLWIDPQEVSCRFGERGSPCVLATFREDKHENKASTMDIEYLLDEHNQRREINNSRFRHATRSRASHYSSNLTKVKQNMENDLYRYYKSTPPGSPVKMVSRPCHYKANYQSGLKSDKFHWVKDGHVSQPVVQA